MSAAAAAFCSLVFGVPGVGGGERERDGDRDNDREREREREREGYRREEREVDGEPRGMSARAG
jgi:hypothetical protein